MRTSKTNGSEEFYDRLSLLYPVVDIFLKPQKLKLFSAVNSYPYGRLLDIGTGDGSNLKYYTNHEIMAVDTSARMLAQAKRKTKGNVQLFHMSGEKLEFPNATFDYVILSHVISVVDNAEKLLEEIDRVLKPNGKLFILNHFTPDNPLKYLDKCFQSFSRLFHFKSVFHICSLQKLQDFKLLKSIDVAMFSYFKLLIYEKSR